MDVVDKIFSIIAQWPTNHTDNDFIDIINSVQETESATD